MKISSAIITGGSGFIGSHLLDRLVSDGVEKILLIDDLSTGLKSNIEEVSSLSDSEEDDDDIESQKTPKTTPVNFVITDSTENAARRQKKTTMKETTMKMAMKILKIHLERIN